MSLESWIEVQLQRAGEAVEGSRLIDELAAVLASVTELTEQVQRGELPTAERQAVADRLDVLLPRYRRLLEEAGSR